jgi:hypothetical protein
MYSSFHVCPSRNPTVNLQVLSIPELQPKCVRTWRSVTSPTCLGIIEANAHQPYSDHTVQVNNKINNIPHVRLSFCVCLRQASC